MCNPSTYNICMEIWVVDVWVLAVVTSGGGLRKFGLLVMQNFCIELDFFFLNNIGKITYKNNNNMEEILLSNVGAIF